MSKQIEAIESLLAEYDMINSAFAKDLREALAEQPAPVQPDETLLSFYQATDFPSLVSAMEGHIKKMQSKLQSNPHTAIDAWNNREMVRAAPQPPAQPAQQEPVAELLKQSRATFERNFGKGGQGWADWIYGDIAELLSEHTSPQPAQRKQLTTQEIREWWASENGLEDCNMSKLDDFEKVVRAVEAKHVTKDAT